MRSRYFRYLFACAVAGIAAAAATAPARADDVPRTTAQVLEQSRPSDWRALDPARTLYLDFAPGRVVIELAPQFAPRHVANIAALAKAGYFDGLAFVRSQDNYVVQFGDPNAEDTPARRALPDVEPSLPMEHDRSDTDGFAALPDGDVYAKQAGFLDGFPVARDPDSGKAWLAHCYGVVGAGRGDAADSGNGAELYVVIGHAPRHLDRNVTLVGRVVKGMELLSTLPRGSGPLGFYETAGERVPIRRVRLAAQVPTDEREALEVLRTDTDTFADYVASRRTRREGWFVDPVGRVELCNVAIPVRAAPPAPATAAADG